MQPQRQIGLKVTSVGASGQIYEVDDSVVMKSGRWFGAPSSRSPPGYERDYASETLFHASLVKDEWTVFRVLSKRPHPNIAEAIELD